MVYTFMASIPLDWPLALAEVLLYAWIPKPGSQKWNGTRLGPLSPGTEQAHLSRLRWSSSGCLPPPVIVGLFSLFSTTHHEHGCDNGIVWIGRSSDRLSDWSLE
ncbi:hypothetical protein FPOAC2_12154 [Fusarium poae]